VQHKSQTSAIESVNSPLRGGRSFQDTPRCAVFTRTSGEDTVGTAPPNSRFLFVEVPLPWPKKVWKAKGVPPGVVEALKQSKAWGLDLKARAIAPDHEYSHPGFTRVLHFRRPEGAFTTFFRDEFLVPCDQAAPLLNALLGGLPQACNASSGSGPIAVTCATCWSAPMAQRTRAAAPLDSHCIVGCAKIMPPAQVGSYGYGASATSAATASLPPCSIFLMGIAGRIWTWRLWRWLSGTRGLWSACAGITVA
jgi:hypothetical protein